MGKVVLGLLRAAGLVLLEEKVDLGVAHLDLVVDFALAQPRQDDLLAQVVAEGVEREAVALERLAEVRERQLVVLGDALDRAIELHVVDAHAGIARELQLRLLQDESLEHLPLEHLARRCLRAAPLELALRGLDRLVELREGDDLLVHDCHDAVDERHALRGRGEGHKERQDQQQKLLFQIHFRQ